MEFVESMEGSKGAAMTSPNAAEFAALLRDVRKRIDDRLVEWLRPRVAAATAISEEVGAVAAAVNDAVNKVAEASRNKLGGVTAGMNLPAGFKMPF